MPKKKLKVNSRRRSIGAKMTTEKLMEKAIETVKRMSEKEKAKLREALRREFRKNGPLPTQLIQWIQ
jgi:hypothetical protein